ncbi:hypothetical protein C0Q70_09255 [Pomacea canaliculata]|uniref:Rab-GAP TBC domain-containing protein n=1 Tax=Pomacea canaliculata TaxID=400727 RepID=A0A2T7P995_POMCA|nr:hypothetical protein C0Q70_09255 [Pomacea canaliculata]
MSEETDTNITVGLKEDLSPEPAENAHLMKNFEDIETLKTQVQRLALHSGCSTAEPSSAREKDNASPPVSNTSERESSLSLSSDDTLNCDDCRNTGHASNDVSLTVDPKNHELFSNGDGSACQPDLSRPCSQAKGIGAGADRYFSRVNSSPETFLAMEYNGSEIISRSHASDNDLPGPVFRTVSNCNEFDKTVRPEPDRVTLNSIESFTSNTLFCDPSARLYTDTSSLSSISTGTEFSASAVSLGDDYNAESREAVCDVDDGTFMEVSLHGRNSYEKARNRSLDSGFEDHGAKPKRKGFSGFLTRGLFSKKSREDSAPGWKLFGRIPPKDSGTKDSTQITSDYYAKQRANQIAAAQSKGQSSDIMSTTALILENRPVGLPSKSPEETEKHKQEYEAMVEAAKKKDEKKKLQQQRRHEDRMVQAANSWNKLILPNWETMKNTKKVRDLWWLGLPPNVRGKVWKIAIGNELNITHDLYEICRSRAEDRIRLIQESKEAPGSPETVSEPPSNKEASVKVIKLDVSRTFPQLCIFQKGGPYHDMMHSLLGAYACYRPDVGYVQGMSFIAAILLLNMEVADAFVCFANLLNRPCQVSFFRMDEEMLTAYYKTFEEFFLENLPQLYAHFSMHHVTPNLYLMEWVFLLFSKSLPLDVACRVWDVYCRDGEEFLFQTAIGILKFYEAILLQMDFIHAAQFLTKLPEDISADLLFKHIETVQMSIDKKKFLAILAHYKDLCTDGIS